MPAPLHTRTLNPLQFEALEPRRFEDLVRQLAYDFRFWRKLEATGRAGSDDGFDARGWEVVEGSNGAGGVNADDDETSSAADNPPGDPAGLDRVWLIQCKREARIGPTKLVGYLNAISDTELKTLYGVVLAAPTNFSKRAYDEFRSWCASRQIAECYLWGRGELEDMLFQPKNDNLLFAYFGISLQIRKRSRQAALRSRTTIKRKLTRTLQDKYSVLLRDAEDTNYPWRQDKADFGWWVFERPEITFRGLEVTVDRFFAFIDEDATHWDYANADTMGPGPYSDPWRGEGGELENRSALVEFWQALPQGQRAMLNVTGVIAFERILEVDELGDDFVSSEKERPHIFVTVPPGLRDPPFDYVMASIEEDRQWGFGQAIPNPKVTDRIVKFPQQFRKPMRAEAL